MSNSDENPHKIEENWAKLSLGFGLALYILLPLILSQKSCIGTFDSATGAIGDTIGGLTAPISGFLGSILIYLAFRAQIKANAIVQNEIRIQSLKQYCQDQIRQVREDIKGFEYQQFKENSIKVYNGGLAFCWLLYDYRDVDGNLHAFDSNDTKFHQSIYILNQICDLVSMVENSEMCKNDKLYINNQIHYLFNFNYQDAIITFITNPERQYKFLELAEKAYRLFVKIYKILESKKINPNL